MLIEAFASAALPGLGDGFAETALQVALALGRASKGAILVARDQAFEVVASTLSIEAQERVEALLSSADWRTRASAPTGAFLLVPFGAPNATMGALYLEEPGPPASSLAELGARLAEILGRYFAHCA